MALGFLLACANGLPNIPRRRRETPRRISRQRDGGVGTTVALNRVLFERNEIDGDGDVILTAADHRATHVRNILRIPDSGGSIRTGVVDSFLVDSVPVSIRNDSTVKFHLSQGIRRKPPRPPAVSLILAVPRPKVLARLLPQIAAIGVQNLVLCNAYKVERCYFDSTLLRRPEEVRTLLLEGVAQSGIDCQLPCVTIERRLRIFLEDRLQQVSKPGSRLLIAEPGSPSSIFQGCGAQDSNLAGPTSHVVLAVGPEGGWMPREVAMLTQDHGFEPVTLGDRILRTDAAVLILLGLVHEYLRHQAE